MPAKKHPSGPYERIRLGHQAMHCAAAGRALSGNGLSVEGETCAMGGGNRPPGLLAALFVLSHCESRVPERAPVLRVLEAGFSAHDHPDIGFRRTTYGCPVSAMRLKAAYPLGRFASPFGDAVNAKAGSFQSVDTRRLARQAAFPRDSAIRLDQQTARPVEAAICGSCRISWR